MKRFLAASLALSLLVAAGATAVNAQTEPAPSAPVAQEADASIKSISESLLETKVMINKLLAFHTGRTEEEMDELTSYDHYFSAQEAVEMRLADGIRSFKEMMEGRA